MIVRLHTINLTLRRPFSWRALWILSVLFIVGKLASMPLLINRNRLTETPAQIIVITLSAFIVIAIFMLLAARSGLGLPLIEGRLARRERARWGYTVLGLAILVALIGSMVLMVPGILVILSESGVAGVESEFAQILRDYPPRWRMILTSIDAGIQEEIFYRLGLVTLVAWLGGFIWHEPDGGPSAAVIWLAIISVGILFGWAHIDQDVLNPESTGTVARYTARMSTVSLLGIVLGWLYWKQGLECAMLAHFLLDALATGVSHPSLMTLDPWR